MIRPMMSLRITCDNGQCSCLYDGKPGENESSLRTQSAADGWATVHLAGSLFTAIYDRCPSCVSSGGNNVC